MATCRMPFPPFCLRRKMRARLLGWLHFSPKKASSLSRCVPAYLFIHLTPTKLKGKKKPAPWVTRQRDIMQSRTLGAIRVLSFFFFPALALLGRNCAIGYFLTTQETYMCTASGRSRERVSVGFWAQDKKQERSTNCERLTRTYIHNAVSGQACICRQCRLADMSVTNLCRYVLDDLSSWSWYGQTA